MNDVLRPGAAITPRGGLLSPLGDVWPRVLLGTGELPKGPPGLGDRWGEDVFSSRGVATAPAHPVQVMAT